MAMSTAAMRSSAENAAYTMMPMIIAATVTIRAAR